MRSSAEGAAAQDELNAAAVRQRSVKNLLEPILIPCSRREAHLKTATACKCKCCSRTSKPGCMLRSLTEHAVQARCRWGDDGLDFENRELISAQKTQQDAGVEQVPAGTTLISTQKLAPPKATGRGCCQSPVLSETVEVVRMFLVKTAAFNETYAGLRPHTGERERPKPALTQPGSDASNDSNVTPKTPASRALRSRACSRGLFGRILRPRPNST